MPRDTSLLVKLTQLPTAAGKEHRVVRFINAWASSRPVTLTQTPSGNLHITMKQAGGTRTAANADSRPVYFTAHLDHPAFVVERIVAPGIVQLSFRGGVMDDYFKQAKVAVFDARDSRHAATLTGKVDNASGPFPHYLAEFTDTHAASSIALGDVAVWDLPPAEIKDGILHTNACDDLAALAAALDAFDILLSKPASTDVRLLFTRAEEIGFIGAIAACREETMPKDSRVIALENSRSFADSPIGGGPIVRVGDRLSIFSPSLTDAIAKRAEELAGAAQPTASQKLSATPAWKWQRKLMAGGACEASVFCAAGYESTCLCLPLGNYHNMADLEAVQAGKNTTAPVVGREFISIDDYFGLVDLLVACAERLPRVSPMSDRIEKLWNERKFVLTA